MISLELSEEDRQLMLLALAKLSLERPGWDYALNTLALKMDNQAERSRAELYDNFRKIDRDTSWHKILDTRDQEERMNDSDLADEIIARLNKLCENPQVRADLCKLIETRIPCTKATLDHPTIQASQPEKVAGLCECGAYGPSSSGWCPICNPEPQVGFLGLLNGLVGIRPEGRLKGWGFIAAVFDDNKQLVRFRRTDATKAP